MQRPSREDNISRHEFEAVIRPMQKDIERIVSITSTAATTWSGLYEAQREQLSRVERQVIFAQGAIAAVAFITGSGVLGLIIFLLQQ